MFKNVGRKIKIVAKVIFWVGVALLAVLWLILFWYGVVESDIGLFVVSLIIPPIYGVLAWISCLSMYGTGQLIENSDILVELIKEKKEENT